ncbi:MAG: phosphatase PAP2 family protein [Elusimicrobia bacterium]|nr:phosphatase PAP2 family protein [Elusimicrobiota bacterium]
MKLIINIIILVSILSFNNIYSQDSNSIIGKHEKDSQYVEPAMVYHINKDTDFIYNKPKLFDFITNTPKDLSIGSKNAFQKKNVFTMGVVFSATALLVAVDQPVVDGAKKIGKQLNIPPSDNWKILLSERGIPIFRSPKDIGSAFYFIGDGWPQTIITGSFLGYGIVKNDYRALQTSSQLAEGLITTTLVTQFLKHITGRQSPSKATRDGGKWDLFPNQKKYLKCVPNYDAFPSGHLATTMMTVTVIADNYAEHKYIRPLGYTLMTILGYQMLNNGVHWVSDYPLALVIGYYFGKIAVAGGRTIVNKNSQSKNSDKNNWQEALNLSPIINNSGDLGLALRYTY